MALRTKVMEPEDWEQYFIEAGISSSSAKTHAVVFANEKLTIATLQMLDRAMLRELGVTSMGEALCILKQAKEATPQATYMKAPTAKLPQLNLEMTPQQFRKFQIDWEVFVKITKTPESQTNIHLYNCANEETQNAIISTHPDFFSTDPSKLLGMLKTLVTRRSNPIVHRLTFASMSQGEDEPIQSYLVRLRAKALDCSYMCPACEHDLSDIYIKDQFIKGVASDALQTDLLAKAGLLKTLEQNISHAEAFESAVRDQMTMSNTPDIARMSTYRRQKSNAQQKIKRNPCTGSQPNHPNNQAEPNKLACIGCGSQQHGVLGMNSRQLKCPAWGQTCNYCKKANHFSNVCRAKKLWRATTKNSETNEASMDTLIAHITFN